MNDFFTMHQPDPKYFDYAASAPPYREALAALAETSEKCFANPSSIHLAGAGSRNRLTALKEEFSSLVGFSQGSLLLCSSGTEANNTLIEGFIRRHTEGRILIAANVHDSIWYATGRHRDHADILPVSETGQVSADALLKALGPATTLVCLSHACGETGGIQDMQEVAGICSERGVRLMIDGVQAVGHIPLELDTLPMAYYTFSAHKFGAARGTGGILLRDTAFDPLLLGGRQEYRLRAGTENVGGLASAVEALKISLSRLEDESRRLEGLSLVFLSKLKARIRHLIVNTPEHHLPGFISLCFPGYSGSEIVAALSHSGFSASTGSACHASQVEPSRTLMAMGRSADEAKGAVRITMGRGTTEEAATELAKALIEFAGH